MEIFIQRAERHDSDAFALAGSMAVQIRGEESALGPDVKGSQTSSFPQDGRRLFRASGSRGSSIIAPLVPGYDSRGR